MYKLTEQNSADGETKFAPKSIEINSTKPITTGYPLSPTSLTNIKTRVAVRGSLNHEHKKS